MIVSEKIETIIVGSNVGWIFRSFNVSFFRGYIHDGAALVTAQKLNWTSGSQQGLHYNNRCCFLIVCIHKWSSKLI